MKKDKKVLILVAIIIIIIIIICCYNIKKIILKNDNTIDTEKMYQQNLKKYGFYIEEMPEKTKEKIKSFEGFEEKLKEFAYKNQIIDYGEANLKYVAEKQEGNMLMIKFEVESYAIIKIIAEIDVEKNTYEFYMYR